MKRVVICFFNNIVGCGPPVAVDCVVIHSYTTTFEGSSITFTCEDGLFPNVTIIATCTGGHWSTDPAAYMCMSLISPSLVLGFSSNTTKHKLPDPIT